MSTSSEFFRYLLLKGSRMRLRQISKRSDQGSEMEMRFKLWGGVEMLLRASVVLTIVTGFTSVALADLITIDFPGATATQAFEINNTGQIVGYYTNGSGTYGFLDSSGVFSTISVPGSIYTDAFGIANSGQIVG